MEGQFSVTVLGKPAGKVVVRKEGLYYHFTCRCHLPDDNIYRLIVSCGTVRENLGILVPQKDSFILNTKLPIKRIGAGEMSFVLVPKQETFSRNFYPISPEEPFAYISRLKESFFVLQNGQPGICITQKQEH